MCAPCSELLPNISPMMGGRYIYGCVRQDELAAYYRDAAVGLIIPLRDGMNLVAKVRLKVVEKDPTSRFHIEEIIPAGNFVCESLHY